MLPMAIASVVDIARPSASYRNVSRYAVTALRSGSLSFMAGIREPGLIASGFWIHSRRFWAVLAAAPDAMVARLIKCPRSGPKRPLAAVPLMVWQFMHAVVSKTR